MHPIVHHRCNAKSAIWFQKGKRTVEAAPFKRLIRTLLQPVATLRPTMGRSESRSTHKVWCTQKG
jgi:hypothetical protein